MNKQLMGVLAVGLGVSAVAGIMGAKKMQKFGMHHGQRGMEQGYKQMVSMKNEFGSDMTQMARRAGRTLVKAGKTVNRLAR